MIRSFRCSKTDRLNKLERIKEFQSIERSARKTLLYLDTAKTLYDLARIPGLRLELLKGDRAGQHSIRINDKYRVCFVWTERGPVDVEITDYH